MNRINFSYSALVLVVTAFAVSLTGCGQKQELDPRTQPELVRIVEIGSSSGADPAEQSWFPNSRKDHQTLGRYGAVCPRWTTAHDD